MKTTFRAWCCAVVFAVARSGAAVEAEPVFHTLFSDQIIGISGDGKTAIGGYGALRWSPPSARELLDDDAFPLGFAVGSSHDASAVAGFVLQLVGERYQTEAFRWNEADGYQLLGPVPGFDESQSQDISSDGSVVVGLLSTPENSNRAFSWSGSELNLLELLPNAGGPDASPYSTAEAVSADGSVIVGSSSVQPGERLAVRWDNGQIASLGDLPGGEIDSYAAGISADGSVIVGTATTDRGREGFRWTEDEGLVSLWPRTTAYDASADGSVIIGAGSLDGGPVEPLLWDIDRGVTSLYLLLSRHLPEVSGWHLGGTESISDDGLVVAGIANAPNDGPNYSYVATVPEPSSTILLAIGFAGLLCGRRTRKAIVR
jgi:probable HAF family extracellular repeat protein